MSPYDYEQEEEAEDVPFWVAVVILAICFGVLVVLGIAMIR